jgi:signal transduction histidine kinase
MYSIRWKLVLTSLLVLVPIYFLNRYAVKSFDRFTSKALEEEMISQAIMLGAHYKSLVVLDDGAGRSSGHIALLLQELGGKLQARFRIVAVDRSILFDSEPGLSVDQRVLEGKELTAATRGNYGARWELSKDRRYVHYYVALPIFLDGAVVAVAHVSRHTGQITKAIQKMVHDQRIALLITVVITALASAVFAQTLTRPLRRLTKAASDHAKGVGDPDLPVLGRDEIGELGRAVAHMSREIERRNQYNKEFVGTVMHELITPLTAIKGAAEVLDNGAGADSGARQKFLSNIRFEVERMIRMVGELTELTRLDTEIPTAEKDDVDYCEFVVNVIDRMRPMFNDGHAQLIVSVTEKPVVTRVVPGHIEQVLTNLVTNAMRYTPASGQIEIRVETQPDGTVETQVKDDGCGIATENIGRVFDRYFTTEPKGEPREYGTGLGLAIAKSIVESYQGSIQVVSTPGEGAVFSFLLPMTG